MENYIEPNNEITAEQEREIEALTTNITRTEYYYSDSFNMESETGKAPPAPIEIFYRLMDGLPTWLKRRLDTNGTRYYQIGNEEFAVTRQQKIGNFKISGLSQDRIYIRDDHNRYYLITGSIALIKGSVHHNNSSQDHQVEIKFRVSGRSYLVRNIMYAINPILRIVLPKIIRKIFELSKPKEQIQEDTHKEYTDNENTHNENK